MEEILQHEFPFPAGGKQEFERLVRCFEVEAEGVGFDGSGYDYAGKVGEMTGRFEL